MKTLIALMNAPTESVWRAMNPPCVTNRTGVMGGIPVRSSRVMQKGIITPAEDSTASVPTIAQS